MIDKYKPVSSELFQKYQKYNIMLLFLWNMPGSSNTLPLIVNDETGWATRLR
jgi:hypothetical protein